jgi:hypothetical protein
LLQNDCTNSHSYYCLHTFCFIGWLAEPSEPDHVLYFFSHGAESIVDHPVSSQVRFFDLSFRMVEFSCLVQRRQSWLNSASSWNRDPIQANTWFNKCHCHRSITTLTKMQSSSLSVFKDPTYYSILVGTAIIFNLINIVKTNKWYCLGDLAIN